MCSHTVACQLALDACQPAELPNYFADINIMKMDKKLQLDKGLLCQHCFVLTFSSFFFFVLQTSQTQTRLFEKESLADAKPSDRNKITHTMRLAL